MLRYSTCTVVLRDYNTKIAFAVGEVECQLKDILIFTSGSDRIPPVGFAKDPFVIFLYSQLDLLPTASTCDIQLRLPTAHKEYDQFQEYMILGIKGHNGFGGVLTQLN